MKMTTQDELMLRLQHFMKKYQKHQPGQVDIAVEHRAFIEAARHNNAPWKAIADTLAEASGRRISPNLLKTWWCRVNKKAI
jgi:hypothetical protein